MNSQNDYQRDEATGRILRMGNSRPFDVRKAEANWRRLYPDPIWRRFVLDQRKQHATDRGFYYEAQCITDLQGVLL